MRSHDVPDPDVLIWVADGQLLDGLDYAARIEQRLAAAGLTSRRRDLTAPAGDPPPPVRAHLFTGGETSVHADEAWMRTAVDTVRRLIADADRADHVVLGICLGSQIIAEALRPDSITGSSAIEVGLTPVERAGDERTRQVVPSFHYQAITAELGTVAGVRVEWRNAHTPVQAFRYGERTFGCQYHPELTAADVHALVDLHAEVIRRWDGDVDAAHRSVDRHRNDLAPDLFRQTIIDRIPR
jgi:GMP synthase-like glutamine amidotransferase